MANLTVSFLGPMLVTLDGQPVTGFEYDKVRALLAYLIVEAERPHRREALAGLLWPEESKTAAHASLRNALATLRQTIRDKTSDPRFLHISREAVKFNRDSDYILDVAQFKRLLIQCDRHRHRRAESCRVCAMWRQEAVDLYHGHFLAQFSLADSSAFDDWILFHREDLHQQALQAMTWLAEYHLSRGQPQLAHPYALQQLRTDPLREEAHRQAMRIQALQGNRSAAMAQYHRCRQVLDEELGVLPGPETTTLYERIRDGRFANDIFGRRPFITPPTQLIGREAEMTTLGAQLADPDCRLITVTGPGGIGKTHLARTAAHTFGPDFADGAVFVPLAALPDSDSIVQAVAQACRVRLKSHLPLLNQLVSYLQSKELLLVLDNFDHLMEGVGLISRLLEATSKIVLLITSRHRLNLRAEWLFELGGLAYPEAGVAMPLSEFSAVRLFVQRARQQRRDFALVSSEAPAIAEICRLVAGMPLAIELASAGVQHHSCTDIVQQLVNSLETLTVEWQDVPPRHRSVRATLDYSWQLLTSGEQQMLRRLAVFRGGFDTDAATAITTTTSDTLPELVGKSLVQQGDNSRFDLHPLVQSFASEQLEAAGETATLHKQHIDYFMHLAETGERALRGQEQLTWLDLLEREHDNILAALDWGRTHAYVDAARLVSAMWLFWFIRGHLQEGRRRYAHLSQQRMVLPEYLRARLLTGYAAMVWAQADWSLTTALTEEAISIFRSLNDNEGIGLSLHHLAIVADAEGQGEKAMTLRQEGLKLAKQQPDQWVTCLLLQSLGEQHSQWEAFADAEVIFNEALGYCQKRGDRWLELCSLSSLCSLTLQQGDYPRARRLIDICLTIARDFRDRRGMAFLYLKMGQVALQYGELAHAAQVFEDAEHLFRELGDEPNQARASMYLGDIAARRGYFAQAQSCYQDSYQLFEAAGDEVGVTALSVKLATLTRIRNKDAQLHIK